MLHREIMQMKPAEHMESLNIPSRWWFGVDQQLMVQHNLILFQKAKQSVQIFIKFYRMQKERVNVYLVIIILFINKTGPDVILQIVQYSGAKIILNIF